jgi:hypothetical protein
MNDEAVKGGAETGGVWADVKTCEHGKRKWKAKMENEIWMVYDIGSLHWIGIGILFVAQLLSGK